MQLVRRGRAYVLSQVGRLYGSAGIPDMICFDRDVGMFFVEVKAKRTDRASAAQLEFARVAGEAGQIVITGNLDSVITFLEHPGRRSAVPLGGRDAKRHH